MSRKLKPVGRDAFVTRYEGRMQRWCKEFKQNYVKITRFRLARPKINDSNICLGAASVIDTAWVSYEGESRRISDVIFPSICTLWIETLAVSLLNNIRYVNRRIERNTTHGNYETNRKGQRKRADNRRKMRVQRSLKGLLFVRAWTSVCPSCKNEASKLRDGAAVVHAQGKSL